MNYNNGGNIMEKITVVVNNEVGLHARPASMFTKTANKFKSDINIIKNGNVFIGKSILQILSMAAGKGDELIIEADGQDEKEAIEAIKELFDNNFGE